MRKKTQIIKVGKMEKGEISDFLNVFPYIYFHFTSSE